MAIEFRQIGGMTAGLCKFMGKGFYASGKNKSQVIEKLFRLAAEERVR